MLTQLVIELEVVFEEATKIITKGPMPSKIDDLFWFSYNEKHLAKMYPEETTQLVIRLLASVSNIGLSEYYISSIVKEMGKLDEKDNKGLKEALLAKNIMV